MGQKPGRLLDALLQLIAAPFFQGKSQAANAYLRLLLQKPNQPEATGETTMHHKETIHVTDACTKNWADLTGEGQKRHCAACNLHVHNAADLTRSAATDIIKNSQDRVCMRVTFDASGQPIHKDSPPSAFKKAGLALAAGTLLAACQPTQGSAPKQPEPQPQTQPQDLPQNPEAGPVTPDPDGPIVDHTDPADNGPMVLMGEVDISYPFDRPLPTEGTDCDPTGVVIPVDQPVPLEFEVEPNPAPTPLQPTMGRVAVRPPQPPK